MKEYIQKLLNTKYLKWILALCIVASGGTVTFQMLSTDEVPEPLKNTVTHTVVDAVSEIGVVKDVLDNVSDAIEQNPVIDNLLNKIH